MLFFFMYLYFECKVFLHVFDDHHKERQLDSQGDLRVSRTGNVCSADIGSHDFQHQRLDVVIRYPLDVSVSNFLVPDLQRLASNAVQDGEESGLEGVLKHLDLTNQEYRFNL